MSEIERALARLSKAVDVLKDNLNKDFSSNALHDSSGGKQRASSFQQSEIAELNTIKNHSKYFYLKSLYWHIFIQLLNIQKIN